MKKRFVSILLCFCMVLSLLPATAMAGNTPDGSVVSPATHTHCVCGGSLEGHTHDSSVTWTGVSALTSTLQDGYYYLTQDVTLTSAWQVKNNVRLCLNGYSITKEGTGLVIEVMSGATLTLTDCQTTAGTITHASGKTGRGIEIDGGTLNLWNGSITGNAIDESGAGVYNEGTFNMYGGTISNNTITDYSDGAGVYNYRNHTFTMYGGSITGNTNARGAGAGVYNDGDFIMSGGSITGNSITGTGLKGDTKSGYGAGVYNNYTFTVSGTVTITGNTRKASADDEAQANNFHIPNGSTPSKVVAVSGDAALDSASRIGITFYNPSGNPTVVSNSTNTTVFTSDDPDYSLDRTVTGVGLMLVTAHKHCECCGDDTDCTHTSETWLPVYRLTDITADGNYYLKSGIVLTTTWTCSYNVKLCLAGHTITGPDGAPAITVAQDAFLTITNCGTNGRITHKSGEYGAGIENLGTLVLRKGTISDNRSTTGGGGVVNSGVFTMYGGEIIDNTGTDGAGVANTAAGATFNLRGGEISGNESTATGGGVANSGSFHMYGGTVTDNTSGTDGGGVYNAKNAAFYLSGGAISDNDADHCGGGVFTGGAMTASGGSITGNCATGTAPGLGRGGGVYVNDPAALGRGTLTVSGTVTITGNLGNGGSTVSNVFLPLNSDNPVVITVDAAGLQNGARIGLNVEPGGSTGLKVVSGTTDDSCFFYDGGLYDLASDGSDGLVLAIHSHCTCGHDSYDGHAHDAPTPSWNAVSDLSDITADGYYFLKRDITGSWTCDYNVTLCLAGHTITGTSGSPSITVSENKTLTITDCGTTGTITHKSGEYGSGIENRGTLILWKGTISDNSSTSGGGGVANYGTFTMYDGSITENSASNSATGGGGVYNRGTFTMKGGSITRNVDVYHGGGVHNTGTFVMEKGTISENSAYFGGGVHNYNGGGFEMNAGCSISANTATYGGGIYHDEWASYLKIRGGEIKNNTASKNGGGILTSNNKAEISLANLTVTGNSAEYGGGIWANLSLTLAGPVTIKSNNGGNLYLCSPLAVTASSAAEGSDIGVSVRNPSGYIIANGISTNIGFTSDNENYEVVEDKTYNKLKLSAVPEHIHCVCGSSGTGSEAGHDNTQKWTRIESLDAITSGGYYRLNRDIVLTQTWVCDKTGVYLCLAGHTITGPDGAPAITVSSGASLTITDCGDAGTITHAAGTTGRGIEISDAATLTLWSVNITGNSEGVYNNGTLNLCGMPEITGNTDGNVVLPEGKTINVTGELDSDALVGITGADGQTVVTGTSSRTGFFADSDSFFLNPESNSLKLVRAEAHTHCVCGSSYATESTHSHEAISWKPLSGTITGELPSGNYYLYGDVTVSSGRLLVTGEVNLCLNGHSLIGAGNNCVIMVHEDGTLAITDCVGTGKITHNSGSDGCGIINLGQLILWNGSITGNTSSYMYGGGVLNATLFTMYGGSITGNRAMLTAGGLFNYGTFNMAGGSITNNIAVEPSVEADTDLTCSGAGIANVGTVNLSGLVTITGNKAAGKTRNLTQFNLDDEEDVYATNPVLRASGISSASRVGVTMYNPSVGLTVVENSVNNTVFTSDDSAYTLAPDAAANCLKLALASSDSGDDHGGDSGDDHGGSSDSGDHGGSGDSGDSGDSGKDTEVTSYIIQASAGKGGTVKPSGAVSVRAGTSQAFTFTPEHGYTVSDVLVDGKSVGARFTYSFEYVRKAHTIEVVFVQTGEDSGDSGDSDDFVDVDDDSYYREPVDWAVEQEITSGTDSRHFSPADYCTRAQAVTFLWRAAGCPAPEAQDMPFADVPEGSYYHDAVLWAVENGIALGTSDTTFSPADYCTRAQIVTFLYRAEKLRGNGMEGAWMFRNPFTDVDIDSYYGEAVMWAIANNVTTGTSDTTFSPADYCTRAQIVTFIYRAYHG